LGFQDNNKRKVFFCNFGAYFLLYVH
jgi:hypothetical protein